MGSGLTFALPGILSWNSRAEFCQCVLCHVNLVTVAKVVGTPVLWRYVSFITLLPRRLSNKLPPSLHGNLIAYK